MQIDRKKKYMFRVLTGNVNYKYLGTIDEVVRDFYHQVKRGDIKWENTGKITLFEPEGLPEGSAVVHANAPVLVAGGVISEDMGLVSLHEVDAGFTKDMLKKWAKSEAWIWK